MARSKIRTARDYVGSTGPPVIICCLIGAVLLLAFASVGTSPAKAQPSGWPATWLALGTDATGECSSRTFRDVVSTSYAKDDDYLYLRMTTNTDTGWPDTGGGQPNTARYKWWFDTAGGDMYVSGTSLYLAEYLMFVEDLATNTSDPNPPRDGLGEITFMDDLGNVGFASRWDSTNPPLYANNGVGSALWHRALGAGTPLLGGPQGVTTDADIGYRISGANLDMYVSWAALGEPTSLCLMWATDEQNNNLDQAPNCDRPTSGDCLQIELPTPTPAPSDTPVPTDTPAPTNTPAPTPTPVIVVGGYGAGHVNDAAGGTQHDPAAVVPAPGSSLGAVAAAVMALCAVAVAGALRLGRRLR